MNELDTMTVEVGLYPTPWARQKIVLTSAGITYTPCDSEGDTKDTSDISDVTSIGGETMIKLEDIVGCSVQRSEDVSCEEAYWCVYSYPHQPGWFTSATTRTRLVTSFVFDQQASFEENKTDIDKWRRGLQGLLDVVKEKKQGSHAL